MTSDNEWEEYCKKMVVKDDKWWEDWLAKMNKYMEEQHLMSPPPPKPEPTEEEKEDNRKDLGITKCLGCGLEGHDSGLNDNLLCEDCIKKGSDKPSFVKLGNPEMAFFLQRFGHAPEILIGNSICYLGCPKCNYNINHLKDMTPRVSVYRMIFDHYVKNHYILEAKEHSPYENLAYAILQEFTIYESGLGRSKGQKSRDNHRKKALAMHNIMKHLGIPLHALHFILELDEGRIGNLAFDGIEHCGQCSRSYNNPKESS